MYMVLQPLGGLNDILCTIHRCKDYCLTHNRKLIIHTANLRDHFLFPDGIEKYLYSQDENILLGLPRIQIVRERLAPWVDEGVEGSPWISRFGDVDAIKNLNCSYQEDVIIYQAFGGGFIGGEAFKYLDLQPSLKEYIKAKLVEIPGDYHAIHFRHTDYKSDIQDLRNLIKSVSRDGKHIYLATDNGSVLRSIKQEFGEMIINLTGSLSEDCLPIHLSQLSKEEYASYDAIADIAILAFAESLSCPRLMNPTDPLIEVSGFCLLARHLRNLEKHLLKQIFID